jgi:drug/metabolite transporter (DMT)-like permease
MLISLLFALAATVLNSIAGLMQSEATRHATRRRPLAAQPWYLAGLLVDGLGWVATVGALQHLPVFVVQAVQGGAIALTAIGARLVYGTALRRIDRMAIGGCLAGLVVLAGSAGPERPPPTSWAATLGLIAALAVLVVAVFGTWSNGRAWQLAVIAGLGFGGSSLAVRAVGTTSNPDVVVAVLLQPATYLVAAFWVVGLVAYSRALPLTSLAKVTAVLLVTEVVVPGFLGIALLGDTVRAGWWVPMIVGLALSVVGVAVLAGSPAQHPPRPTIHRRRG